MRPETFSPERPNQEQCHAIAYQSQFSPPVAVCPFRLGRLNMVLGSSELRDPCQQRGGNQCATRLISRPFLRPMFAAATSWAFAWQRWASYRGEFACSHHSTIRRQSVGRRPTVLPNG